MCVCRSLGDGISRAAVTFEVSLVGF
jgi:hypothetical protein